MLPTETVLSADVTQSSSIRSLGGDGMVLAEATSTSGVGIAYSTIIRKVENCCGGGDQRRKKHGRNEVSLGGALALRAHCALLLD